jgi:hypothetical protein
MTLAGCLYNEVSIPGRSSNVAEKAGVSEDYILADATTAPERSSTSSQRGASAGLATSRMYKVTKLDDERLKAMVGKRVEVTGSIKVDNDLPNIEATAIREAAGEACPARPAGTSPATSAPNPNR